MESKNRERNKGTRRPERMIAGVILILAVLMIVYGIDRGEVSIVLNKAINVCLECIGLG